MAKGCVIERRTRNNENNCALHVFPIMFEGGETRGQFLRLYLAVQFLIDDNDNYCDLTFEVYCIINDFFLIEFV